MKTELKFWSVDQFLAWLDFLTSCQFWTIRVYWVLHLLKLTWPERKLQSFLRCIYLPQWCRKAFDCKEHQGLVDFFSLLNKHLLKYLMYIEKKKIKIIQGKKNPDSKVAAQFKDLSSRSRTQDVKINLPLTTLATGKTTTCSYKSHGRSPK